MRKTKQQASTNNPANIPAPIPFASKDIVDAQNRFVNLQHSLASALNQVLKRTFRSLEVEYVDEQGKKYSVHIYRCTGPNADYVRADFRKVK